MNTLTPYRPQGPKRLIQTLPVTFDIRPDTSDWKAVEEVWSKNAYRRVKDGFDINPGDTWLDAGANIGAFSVLAWYMGATPIALEAEPNNATITAHNLDINGAPPNVHHAALVPDTHTQPTIDLHINTTPLGLRRHSTVKARRGSTPTPVPAITITEAMNRWQPTGAKLNIEGTEIPILTTWTPPPHLHYLVTEWSFDVDPHIATLHTAITNLRDRYPNVHLSKRINWTQDTWPYYPPNVYIHAWDNP